MDIRVSDTPAASVPAFLSKLWKMVDNPESDDLVAWTNSGSSFVILDQMQFSKMILPYYYKHSNISSFIRQLNMYGFHKISGVESGSLKSEEESLEFAHQFFLRGQEGLLDNIKRKVKMKIKSDPYSLSDMEKVNNVLSEVEQIKERQESIEERISAVQFENEALWNEVLKLRNMHSQQQQTVNNLVKFLSVFLHSNTKKRAFEDTSVETQLALGDITNSLSKFPRIEEAIMKEINAPQTLEFVDEGTVLLNDESNLIVGKLHKPQSQCIELIDKTEEETMHLGNLPEMWQESSNLSFSFDDTLVQNSSDIQPYLQKLVPI